MIYLEIQQNIRHSIRTDKLHDETVLVEIEHGIILEIVDCF